MIAQISYSLGCIAFLFLTLWLFYSWRGRLRGALLLSAVAATTVWLGVAILHTYYPSLYLLHLTELLRAVAWLVFLFHLLRSSKDDGWVSPIYRPLLGVAGIALFVLVFLEFYLVLGGRRSAAVYLGDVWVYQSLLLALTGIVVVEQLFRNARQDKRWALKFMLLGLGGLFVYDFFLYADALLFKQVDFALWSGRGVVHALVVPFIAVAAARQRDWSLDVFMSRAAVFHGTGLAGAGVYLLVMASAGYYIRLYGGSWGGVMQAAFLFAALMLLLVVLFSGQMRAAIKVYINKHFFNYKYDYRSEWLRFIDTIVVRDAEVDIRERSVHAIAQIVDSPGGILWMREGGGDYQVAARYNSGDAQSQAFGAASALPQFLLTSGWVVDLQEYCGDPSRYRGLDLPTWLTKAKNLRLVIPLMHGVDLLGMVLLLQPRANRQINWEDHDLLKTVGRQAAGYLALMQTSEALGQARQFEAFNRLSAFVVHDLKNVIAQLSLVTINARRHRQNPAFIDDAFSTIENAVERMNRMLSHLRKDQRREGGARELVNLPLVLEQVCERRNNSKPIPVVLGSVDEMLQVQADKDRLASVLEHLVQNAQDATPDDGRVQLKVSSDQGYITLEIEDSGCGMDEAFVRDRLFKPFDTTKGNAGMGIGVYETREYIQQLGGGISVLSTPGQGTIFTITLPLSKGLEYPQDTVQLGEQRD